LTDVRLARRLLGAGLVPLVPALVVSIGAVLVMVLTGSRFAVVREGGGGAPVALPWLALATSGVATIPSALRGPHAWFEAAQPSLRSRTIVVVRLLVLVVLQVAVIAACHASLPLDAPQWMRLGPALTTWAALQTALVMFGIASGVPGVALVLASSLLGTTAALMPPEWSGSLIASVPDALPGPLLLIAALVVVARPQASVGSRGAGRDA
jgi:hypothetical protein